jgi:putative ABC transport system ATP-binding protein
MSYIKAEDLSKEYGTGESAVSAVSNANFEVDAGEFVAIMGESGSGKSTLLSILGTLNRPTTGRLTVNGMDIYGLGQDERADFRRQSVGFVFQNFNLLSYLTLVENVMLPLATLKVKKREKQMMAYKALERVGLAEKVKRLPSQISGGEQERVAIARAIVNRPPILLADEPTGNLDTRTGRLIMEFLRSLNTEGITIVMVTHSMEYSHFAGRVLHMSDGMLVQ